MISVPGFKTFSRLFISALASLCVFPAFSQGVLPEGAGRDLVILSCTQCHGLNYLGDVSLTGAQWENALYDMIARGAIVEKDDLAVLKEYLIDNYANDR